VGGRLERMFRIRAWLVSLVAAVVIAALLSTVWEPAQHLALLFFVLLRAGIVFTDAQALRWPHATKRLKARGRCARPMA
jgi:hypothetical protein